PNGKSAQPQPLAMPAGAQLLPQAGATGKQEALRLIAQGRAALERGDIPGALRSVTAAETLSVPESAFAPGEPRVWQLALDVQSAARRAGVSPSSSASISDDAPQSMVRQASNVQPAGGTQ